MATLDRTRCKMLRSAYDSHIPAKLFSISSMLFG